MQREKKNLLFQANNHTFGVRTGWNGLLSNEMWTNYGLWQMHEHNKKTERRLQSIFCCLCIRAHHSLLLCTSTMLLSIRSLPIFYRIPSGRISLSFVRWCAYALNVFLPLTQRKYAVYLSADCVLSFRIPCCVSFTSEIMAVVRNFPFQFAIPLFTLTNR